MKTSSLLRVLGALTAGGALGVGLIGFAHTEAGRPLLALLPSMGDRCPVGADLSPEERDAVRAEIMDGVRGDVPAASRVALGFQLAEDDSASVQRWAEAHGAACTVSDALIRCADVPGEAVGRASPVDDLQLRFDANRRLVSVVASQGSLSAADAATRLQDERERMVATSGAWSASSGDPSASHLAAGPLAHARYDFAFADYHATLTATNLGAGRVALRMAHQAIDGHVRP